MPLEPTCFPDKSPLIPETLQQQLDLLLQKLTASVELTCILAQDDNSQEMAAVVNHLVSLSPKLTCRFLACGEVPELDSAMDSSLLPATGVAQPGSLPRMIFHGIPGGKEINAFASAFLTAGAAGKPLDKPTMKDIGKIRKPMVIQVCVSLGCQHCSQLVGNAQRIALENPRVSAHMIDANLYPELVKAYNIQRVPLTVVNASESFSGGKTMAELTTLLAKY